MAEKEERAHLDTVPRGVETTATGRLEVLRAPEIVRDYWVRAEAGTWYLVSLDKFRAAEVGRPLEVCQSALARDPRRLDWGPVLGDPRS